jgi:hypothetical protein
MTRDVGPGDAADLARQFGDRLVAVGSPWQPCISNLFRVHHGVGSEPT